MKTIIVATNYTNASDNSINYAGSLARQIKAKIILFNSFELSVHAANTLLPAVAIDELITLNHQLLKKKAVNTATKFGVTVECISRNADFKEELDFQVERLNADLVVIGMSEFFETWYGNTTENMIRHSTYPILAVPEEAAFGGISKILFAFDPGCINAANNLPMLKEVAISFNAEVEVCHIEKTATETESVAGNTSGYADRFLDKVEHSYKTIAETDVIKAIESEIEKYHADLLVMVPHKFGFWESMWNKSKTSTMTHRTHIPLLSLPNPNLV